MTMTKQEVFNTVARHLLKQGKPAATKNSHYCKYRVKVGGHVLKCAVGVLLPDKLYDEALEGASVKDGDLYGRAVDLHPDQRTPFREWYAETITPNRHLIIALQALHDEAADVDNALSHWKGGLWVIARNYRLDPKIVETWP